MKLRHIQHKNYEPEDKEKLISDEAIELALKLDNPDFLKQAAEFLYTHTHVTYVIIGLLSKDKLHIQTQVFLKQGEEIKNGSYPIKGSPCEEAILYKFCYYPDKAKSSFPNDVIFQELGIESFLGSMLFNPDQEPIGIIALMDTKTIQNPAFAEHLILLLSQSIEEVLRNSK